MSSGKQLEERLTGMVIEQDKDEVIPFLQQLTPPQKKELVPAIKKLHKEYSQIIQEGNTYRSRMTEAQSIILSYAGFVCCNSRDFEKMSGSWMIGKAHLEKILPWYCPPWFSDYINDFRDREWLPYQLDYFYIIELAQRGFLQPHPHIIARTLIPVIFENRDRKTYFVPERLVLHTVTLKEHIWYFFEYETTIHYSNRYVYMEGKKVGDDQSWEAVLQYYAEEGQIDRTRLLKESLLASNRNYNQLLSGWFAGLFLKLKPVRSELLTLQPELFLLFSSPHSKVLNSALQAVKLLVNEANFDRSAFLEQVPVLLASSTKSVVASTLQLLEKIGKASKDFAAVIAPLAAQALVHREESLQKKAASLILKQSSTKEKKIKEIVSLYATTLVASVKEQLAAYLDESVRNESNAVPEHTVEEHGTVLEEYRKIRSITELDEFIFLTSQAFDNNEVYHFDLLLNALVEFQHKIKKEDVPKLEPSFQRALKLFMGDQRSNMGQLESMLAALFLEFGQMLMRKYPSDTSTLSKLYASFMNKSEANQKIWKEHGNNTKFMGSWESVKDRQLYEPHKKLTEAVLKRLSDGRDAPLLSTPTHHPCWIHPEVLVQRMIYYRECNWSFDFMDLQIAISRCWLCDTKEAWMLAKDKLEGETQRLMMFLLVPSDLKGTEIKPEGPFSTEWLWMMAALSKAPAKMFPGLEDLSYNQNPRSRYTGQYNWRAIVEDHETNQYSWENGKFETFKVMAQRKVLRLDISEQKEESEKEGGIIKWFTKWAGKIDRKPATVDVPLLYEHLRITAQYLGIEDRDILRILYLTPNNPGPLLALAIDKCLVYPQFNGETEKRFVINVLQGLYELNRIPGEIGHLFLATCLVCPDKTAASYAAEIWIKGVGQGTVDSRTIGAIIGRQQQIEFVPLKRLNDLILTRLLHISALHDKALEEMIASILQLVAEAPVRHLKKLVSIHTELQATGK